MQLDELFPAKQPEALRSDKVTDGSDELRFDKVAAGVVCGHWPGLPTAVGSG